MVRQDQPEARQTRLQRPWVLSVYPMA